MARTRRLLPAFFLNEDLAACTPHARLLFAALWCLADRQGKLEDRPRRIKIESLPYEDVNIDALLDELVEINALVRYTVNQGRYLAILTFCLHQKPHPNEAASEIPDPIAGWERDSRGVLTEVEPESNLGDTDVAPRARQARVQEQAQVQVPDQELVLDQVLEELRKIWPPERNFPSDHNAQREELFKLGRSGKPVPLRVGDWVMIARRYLAAHNFTAGHVKGCPNLSKWLADRRWEAPLPQGEIDKSDARAAELLREAAEVAQ